MKRILLPLVLTFACLHLVAAERTIAEMSALAAAQLRTAQVKSANGGVKGPALRCLSNEKAYCIFTPEEGDGFVIVAKSTLANPIIGYSTAPFDMNDMPDGLRWFLNETSSELQAAEAGAPHRAPRRTAASYTPVENFITTQWSQEYPYDRKTPNNFPAGCIATALAQCLNYFQWPASADFDGTYYVTTKSGKKETTNRYTEHVASTYNWPYKDTYKSFGNYGDNIPELLRDCGYATYMSYAEEGSGSYTYQAGIALTTIFSYPEESVKFMHYDYLGDADVWAQTIYDELAQRCPVFMGASDDTMGGHAFLFSGVDEDGLVYVNWGWRGTANGYFAITELNPKQGSQQFLFNKSMNIIYGIRPEATATDHVIGNIYGYSGNPYTFRFGTEKDDDDIEHVTLYCDLPYGFINFNSSTFRGVFGIFGQDLTDGTDWVIAPDLQDRDTIPPGYGYAGSSDQYKEFYFYYYVDGEKGLKPGHKYRLSFGVCDDREGTWHSIICNGGELGYDIEYTGDPETSTISEEKTPVPILTSISSPKAASSSSTDATTRVYDTNGRLVYAAPAARFNLWDVPAHGILIIKEGDIVRKVIH